MTLKFGSALSYFKVTVKKMQRQYNSANLLPECIIQMNVDNQIQSFVIWRKVTFIKTKQSNKQNNQKRPQHNDQTKNNTTMLKSI